MRISITVVKIAHHQDLIDRYELPQTFPCPLKEGMSLFLKSGRSRKGLCESAWQTLSPFVMALFHGATDIYSGWMRNPRSVLLSCNDGFRPVSFLVEALD